MGKHRQPRSGRGFFGWLRILLVVTGLGVLAMGLSSYLYVQSLALRIHASPSELKGAQGYLARALPNEPVNMLLLGSDQRGSEKARTDTMMILRINPQKKLIYVLSIPRDTRVKIPGQWTDKINAASALGGVPLAIQTVSEFTGLDIHHWVLVDFKGFEEMVDALGGIEVDVDRSLKDNRYWFKIDIPAGPQQLNGREALGYVRFRHDAKGDFGRIDRQQKFLKALSEKSLELGSLTRLPKVASILADHTSTDLTASEMIAWGRLLRSIPNENIRMTMLPGRTKTINGKSFVLPDQKRIEAIVLAASTDRELPTEGYTAAPKPKRPVVEIRNGTQTSGLANRVARQLRQDGFRVGRVGNADQPDFRRTEIIFKPDRADEARKLKRALGVGSLVPAERTTFEVSSDILIVLGRDAATS